MLSRWTSKCNVTTNATASTLVLNAVHSDSAGYYECSEEHFSGYDVRFRVKLMVSGGYLYSHERLHQQEPYYHYNNRNLIVIVISKLLKRHSKAKRRAPAYSRALRLVRGVVQRIVRGRSESGFQRIRGAE